VKDSENFGARITEIRVAVAKIWHKEFRGLMSNFWKVARVYLEIFLKTRGLLGNLWIVS
jgi:hypothetical protein